MNRLVASWTDAPSAVKSVHLWNGWSQVGEYEVGAATRSSSLVGGPSGWLGHRTGSGSFMADSHDHQGSRKDGIIDTPLHEPFGDVVGGALPSQMAFQGQEWRNESGLYYMRHRWYASDVGRWMSRDPILQASVSNYDFVGGDPVHGSDPMGLAAVINNMSDGSITLIPQPECANCPSVTIPGATDVYLPGSLPGAQDGFATPNVRWRHRPAEPRFGPSGAFLETGDYRERDTHGGGSGLPDWAAPYQSTLKWTLGCTRGYNADLQSFGGLMEAWRRRYDMGGIPYFRIGTPPRAPLQSVTISPSHPFVRAVEAGTLQIYSVD